tara:strand:- start:62 stop:769 length:708 start_codon:yes stop_codon:yes gene_type:complete
MNKLFSFIDKIIEYVGTFIYLTIWSIAGLFSEKCEIHEECLRCNYSIEESFDIMEIDVYNYNSKGIPKEYKEKLRYRCAPISNLSYCLSDSVHNDLERKIISECREIMDTIMQLNGNTIGGSNHNKRITEYIKCGNTIDSIKQINLPFEPEKRIYFNEKNKNYKWGLTLEHEVWNGVYYIDCQNIISDTLPFTLSPNKWYLIDLSKQTSQIESLFFRLKDDGEIEQHYLNSIKYN